MTTLVARNTATTHTPEPWVVGHETRIYMGGAIEAREIAVATKADPSERVKAAANAARIVACINGCTGLNPNAYWECVRTLRKIAYGNDSGVADDILAKQALDEAYEGSQR